jgi:uncharacterized protein YfbU (UPF0304 family)
MKLSKKDRLMLINQYRILEELDNNNSRHYANYIEILEHGYEIFYSDMIEWVFDEMPEAEGLLVLDVLSIYREIENYKRENPDDDEIINHTWGYFEGFDGNNEPAYHNFTLFLIDKYDRFTEQNEYRNLTDSFNSHSPRLDKYRGMIDKWNELNKDLSTRDNILAILEA